MFAAFKRPGGRRVDLRSECEICETKSADGTKSSARLQQIDGRWRNRTTRSWSRCRRTIHIPVARNALEANCHVLIEKPLSVSMDGVDELMQAAIQKERVAAVGYVYRAHPSLTAMRQAIVERRAWKARATRRGVRPKFSDLSTSLSYAATTPSAAWEAAPFKTR